MVSFTIVDVDVVPSVQLTPVPPGLSSFFPESESSAGAAALSEAAASEPEDCPCAASSAFIVCGAMPPLGRLCRTFAAAESGDENVPAAPKLCLVASPEPADAVEDDLAISDLRKSADENEVPKADNMTELPTEAAEKRLLASIESGANTVPVRKLSKKAGFCSIGTAELRANRAAAEKIAALTMRQRRPPEDAFIYALALVRIFARALLMQ